jgi:hypothetical protein
MDSSIASNFSLVVGGPFYKALAHMRLVGHPVPNIVRRILALLLLTWMPLLVLSAAGGTAFGKSIKISFLSDFSIHARLWAALPLLVIAEIVIDPWIRRVVSTFDSSGVINENDRPAYHTKLQKIERLRDSGVIELGLALLSWFPFFLFVDNEWVSSKIPSWHGSTFAGVTTAGWWFALISGPMLRFLIFRWLWRYILWSILLRSVAKLHLNLMPTHPDLMGGLGFVLRAQGHFGVLSTALGSILAGHYANQIAFFGAHVFSAQASLISFIILSIIAIVAPLTLLSPRLFETQRNGLARYSQLGRRLTAAFDAKWTTGTDSAGEAMLGNPDPSSLIDFISSYDIIGKMKIIPLNKRLVIQVAAQAAAPFAVVWFFTTPVEQIIKTLLGLLF